MALTPTIRALVGASALLLGCGGELAPAPASADGASPSDEATTARPADVAAHAVAIDALLGDLAPPVAPERLRGAPIQRLALRVDDVAHRVDGRLAVAVLNTTGAVLSELAFALAPNADADLAGGARRLPIGAVRVAGAAVEPRGDAHLLRVPVTLAPGRRAQVEIDFAVALPALPAPRWGLGRADAEALFELVTGDLSGATALGYRDGVLGLARAYPLLVPFGPPLPAGARVDDVGWLPVSHFEVSVTAPTDLVLAASGVERERRRGAQGLTTTVFVAAAARHVALVASRRFAVERLRVGAVEVDSFYRVGAEARGAEIARVARRALEVYEGAWGRYPRRRLVLAQAPLPGSLGGARAAGVVMISDLFYAAPAEPAGDDALLAVLTRHPQLQEALEFVVARQVARGWWGELVATDRAAEPWVDEALSGVGALRYFKEARGDKAARRQRTLQLELAYQLSRLLGGSDRPVASSTRQLSAPVEVGGIAHGKAGVYLDTQRRAMSDALYLEALRQARERHAHGVMRGVDLEASLVARSPRPEEARRRAQRWLRGAHADEDIGGLRPDVLAEYLLGDALTTGAARELLKVLAKNEQFGELIDALTAGGPDGGRGVDAGRLLKVLAEAFGAELGPEASTWAELAAKLVDGRPSQWGPAAMDAVLDAVGGDLGVDEEDRALLSGMASLLFHALDGAAPADVNTTAP